MKAYNHVKVDDEEISCMHKLSAVFILLVILCFYGDGYAGTARTVVCEMFTGVT